MLSFCGILCANDFYEAVSGLIVPVQIEQRFYSLQDLKSNNITLLIAGYTSEDSCGKLTARVSKRIRQSGVKYSLIHERFKREIENMHLMYNTKNISIAVTQVPDEKIYDSTITVNSKIIARRSDIIEDFQVISMWISRSSVFREKLSHFYWNFYEHGLHLHDKFAYPTAKLRRQIILNNLDNTELSSSTQEEDSNEADFFTFTILIVILISGSLSALVALSAEITHAQRGSDEQLFGHFLFYCKSRIYQMYTKNVEKNRKKMKK